MIYSGRVASFDEAVGLGEVVVTGVGAGAGVGAAEVGAADGEAEVGTAGAADGERYGFHCTQIADGSRSIPVGAEVTFSRVPGRLGRWEAAGVTPAQ